MVKSVCNITEFAKAMLHNYIKVVRLKPDQPNQWLWACKVFKNSAKPRQQSRFVMPVTRLEN